MLTARHLSALLLGAAACAVPGVACAGPDRPAGAAPAAPAPSSREADARTARALILGGGTTPEEGEAWMRRWEKAHYFHGEPFEPAKGYPKLVRSDDVPGLKPGFHVVLLGICPAADATSRLEFVKSFFPGTYARPVDVPADACPEMPYRTELAASRTIVKGTTRLVVNLYFAPEDEELDPEAWREARVAGRRGPGQYRLFVASFDGDLLKHYRNDRTFPAGRIPGGRMLCKLELSGTAERIVVDATCDEEDPPACTGRTTHSVTRTTYRLDGKAVEEQAAVLEERVSKYCD